MKKLLSVFKALYLIGGFAFLLPGAALHILMLITGNKQFMIGLIFVGIGMFLCMPYYFIRPFRRMKQQPFRRMRHHKKHHPFRQKEH